MRLGESPAVLVDDPDGGGMPRLLEALMRAAVARKPRLARRIRGSLALRSTDVPAGATVRFERTRIVVAGSVAQRAWLVIEGDARSLAELGAGGHGLAALRSGNARMRGHLRHPVFALRVWRLLAAARSRA